MAGVWLTGGAFGVDMLALKAVVEVKTHVGLCPTRSLWTTGTPNLWCTRDFQVACCDSCLNSIGKAVCDVSLPYEFHHFVYATLRFLFTFS